MKAKRYWILESRGPKKKWQPYWVKESAASAEKALGKSRQFDKIWHAKSSIERRVVPVTEVL